MEQQQVKAIFVQCFLLKTPKDSRRVTACIVCQNGDITLNTIVNEQRFSEGWTVFGDSASLVVKFVKTLHGGDHSIAITHPV